MVWLCHSIFLSTVNLTLRTLQAQHQHAAERVQELTQALSRAMAERDEALRILQQLTSAYADLLASSTTAAAAAAADNAGVSPGTLSSGASAAASGTSHVAWAQTQTEPLASDRASGVAACMGGLRDACVQVSEGADSVASGAETVAETTGVTRTLMDMQTRLAESQAAEREAVARMRELQEEVDVAKGASTNANAALEAAKIELQEVQNLLDSRQKLLEDAIQEKEHAQGAKEKAEERLARIQVCNPHPLHNAEHLRKLRKTTMRKTGKDRRSSNIHIHSIGTQQHQC